MVMAADERFVVEVDESFAETDGVTDDVEDGAEDVPEMETGPV